MKKQYGYALYLIISVIIGLEFSLRCLGYQHGTFRKQPGFNEVDSLIVYENFINDSFGVYRFSTWISDSIPTFFNRKDETSNIYTPEQMNYIHYVWQSALMYCELDQVDWGDDIHYIWQTSYCLNGWLNQGGFGLFNQEEDWETPFPALIESLRDTTKQLMAFDSLVLEYSVKPFNSNGFRSISFRPVRSNRLKVLILGDSFAYGMTARPYFNSFPDHLLAMGYLVYNTGIPGVDPAQYAAVVDEYLDILNPDVVIVNLYIGNDLMPFPRVPHANRPHEHMTNAGFFTSSPLGTYLSAQEAYAYYLSLQKLPMNKENQVVRICSKSAIGSLLWYTGYLNGCFGHPVLDEYKETYAAISEATRLTNTSLHLQRIKNRCDSSETRVLYCVIPNRFEQPANQGGYHRTEVELLNKLFGEIPYHEPKNLVASDFYESEDYHFSNKGHQKYAAFLDSLIGSNSPILSQYCP